ncbi:hypothetical protein DFJ73DRAFT_863902, partial [Zopfochytrium polystomum]
MEQRKSFRSLQMMSHVSGGVGNNNSHRASGDPRRLTVQCRHFAAKGHCHFGDTCNFLHGQNDPRRRWRRSFVQPFASSSTSARKPTATSRSQPSRGGPPAAQPSRFRRADDEDLVIHDVEVEDPREQARGVHPANDAPREAHVGRLKQVPDPPAFRVGGGFRLEMLPKKEDDLDSEDDYEDPPLPAPPLSTILLLDFFDGQNSFDTCTETFTAIRQIPDTAFRVARNARDAKTFLTSPSDLVPRVVLAFDEGVTQLCETLRDYVRNKGGLVIIFTYAASMMTTDDFHRLFSALDVPWRQGSGGGDENRISTAGQLFARGLDTAAAEQPPRSFHAKCARIANVAPAHRLYEPSGRTNPHNETAVALRRVGRGFLAYIGDVNGSLELTVCLARWGVTAVPAMLALEEGNTDEPSGERSTGIAGSEATGRAAAPVNRDDAADDDEYEDEEDEEGLQYRMDNLGFSTR